MLIKLILQKLWRQHAGVMVQDNTFNQELPYLYAATHCLEFLGTLKLWFLTGIL